MNKEKFENLLFLDVEATGLEEEDRLVQVAYDFEGVEKEEKRLFRQKPLPTAAARYRELEEHSRYPALRLQDYQPPGNKRR